MVWTFMGNTRMYNALRDYGDRISQIGLFSFKVRATGEIYESGVAISNMIPYLPTIITTIVNAIPQIIVAIVKAVPQIISAIVKGFASGVS